MRGKNGVKRNRGFSFFRARGANRARVPYAGDHAPVDDVGKLKGSALEEAYRALLLEHQVLQETNQRLHERIARQESGLEESPAAKELIRAQRNALADRSHQLRQLEYETKQLQREKKKLLANNNQLSAKLAKRAEEIRVLTQRQEADGLVLAETEMALREAKNELAKLADKYYQLEARLHRPSAGSAADRDRGAA